MCVVWECGGVGCGMCKCVKVEVWGYWNVFYQKSDVFKCMSY